MGGAQALLLNQHDMYKGLTPGGEGESSDTVSVGSGPVGSFPTAEVQATPTGVDEVPADVVCDDPEKLIPVSTKQAFSVFMGCNRGGDSANVDQAQYAVCAPYGKGGCDNETCHDMCNKFYHSHNDYEKCRCTSWGDAKKFKDFSKGAPCPLKVQPRCYNGHLYRSECEALNANQGITAADLAVASQSSWPDKDMSSVKENSSVCAK